YMAPEQRAGEADPRSDQYSFCVALYEALYREHPFADAKPGDGTPAATPAGGGPIVVPSPPRSAVPRAIRAAILRGLAPDPAARHASMDALLDILARTVDRGRTAWRAVAAVGAVAVIGAVLAIEVLRSAPPRPCAPTGRDLAGVWDAATQDKVRAAFAAAGRG